MKAFVVFEPETGLIRSTVGTQDATFAWVMRHNTPAGCWSMAISMDHPVMKNGSSRSWRVIDGGLVRVV